MNNEQKLEPCDECGRMIYEMQRSVCEACAQGMAGGGSSRPSMETLAEDYWRLAKVIEDLIEK